MDLNVVYIGPQTFPFGAATTKRRRYMVDYMNSKNIKSYYLITALRRGKQSNDIEGQYGLCTYYDLSFVSNFFNFHSYITLGKQKLKEWYISGKKNILIFHTLVTWNEWLFYKYAKKIGYKVIFDQVETSYLQNESGTFLYRAQVRFSEFLSHRAYRECPAFVISSSLMRENLEKYPSRRLCLLPNSTPLINEKSKTFFNKPLLLLYSGTYTPKDGVKYLIEGVINAYNDGVNCKLILLGRGTKKDMEVLDTIKDKDFIEYRGFVSDSELNETMKVCDILCMTRTNSRFANFGFPFKLSEYLSTGNILLATNVGDVCQYVHDKQSAFIVEPENSFKITKAIKYIDDHHEESLKIAHEGHLVMMNNFSIDNIGKIFINFLEEL